MVIRGKVYLVKIKESEMGGARDLVWAVCQEMNYLLAFMGLKTWPLQK